MNLYDPFPLPEVLMELYPEKTILPPLKVSAHFHTPYSFSAFSSIDEIFAMAGNEKVDVLGINDFITAEGFREFAIRAKRHKKYPLFNMEFMGLEKEAQEKGIRINDPNNPGRIYFCGKGLRFPFLLNKKNSQKLDQVFQESLNQMKEMIRLLNLHLKNIHAPFRLDYAEVLDTYTKGLVRERHLAQALRYKIINHFPDQKSREPFITDLYSGKPSGINPTNPSAFDNEIRSRLLKKGGVAYVEENPLAFLSLEEMIDIILDACGIPCYPVLLDDEKGDYTEFEKDFKSLYHELTNRNIYAIELIPQRNDFDIFEKFVNYFHSKGFLITFGTEHNTPDLIPLTVSCRKNTPIPERLLAINYQSACVIAAHQYLISLGREGYLLKNGSVHQEKMEEFVRLGNGVIRYFNNY